MLYEVGLLTRLDSDALSTYCEAYATWVKAKEKIGLAPIIKSPKSGYPVMSPYYTIANQAFSQMQKMLAEFGMTPSSRSRIGVSNAQTQGDDKKAEARRLFD